MLFSVSTIGDGSLLYYQTCNSHAFAVAPGTAKNRLRQANIYLTFATCYKFDYLNPSPLNATMFIQYLANSFTSPASIKNVLSGARTWINNHMGSPLAFDSPPAQELLRKLSATSEHVPTPALPISEIELDTIVRFLRLNPTYPRAVLPCVLMSFVCMFRASNVTSPSLNSWGGPHTLRVCDISYNDSSLWITIRSTKTSSAAKPHLMQVYPARAHHLCPVRSWISYVEAVKPNSMGPAFINDIGQPLTTGPVVSAIRTALSYAGYSDISRYSMHSFRRGAVQLAQRLGASNKDIMNHGLWKSESGLKYYTKPVSSAVARAMAHGLAN